MLFLMLDPRMDNNLYRFFPSHTSSSTLMNSEIIWMTVFSIIPRMIYIIGIILDALGEK